MKYRKLGASDLNVSEISLGSWLTYGVGVEKDKALACVNRAFELDINFIDTANVYGRGAAESFLGEALAGRKRDSYVLATKLWGDMGGGNQGLSRAQVEKQLDDSLKRLRTDYVDLYQCHRYDPNTPLEETMEALTRAKQSGKVRWIGFSEWSPQQIEASIALKGVEHFVSSQPQYSLLYRRIEKKVIPISAANGISQIVWSPIAQGVLSGKYLPGAKIPDHTRASSDAMGGFIKSWLETPVLEAVAGGYAPFAFSAWMAGYSGDAATADIVATRLRFFSTTDGTPPTGSTVLTRSGSAESSCVAVGVGVAVFATFIGLLQPAKSSAETSAAAILHPLPICSTLPLFIRG